MPTVRDTFTPLTYYYSINTASCGYCGRASQYATPECVALRNGKVEIAEPERQEVQVEHLDGARVERSKVLVFV